MGLWSWLRRGDARDDEYPEPLDVASVWDEQLSAHLDGELDEPDAAAVTEALEADPALGTRLNELAAVRDALGSLGELRAPRPFTLEAPSTAGRSAPGRFELVFRMGAVAAAVAFAVVLAGDFAGLGGEGVEGWGISRPGFGGGQSEQAGDAPQAAAPAAFQAVATAAPGTPVAAQAEQAAATPTAAATAAVTAAATSVAAAAPTVAAAAGADEGQASPAPTIDSRTAARTRDSEESATPAAAAKAPTPAAAAPQAESQASATPEAEREAAEAADAADGSESAAPAAGTAAAPLAAATEAPEAQVAQPQAEPEAGDGGGAALRTAEQGLLLATIALVGLALLLARRRGGAS